MTRDYDSKIVSPGAWANAHAIADAHEFELAQLIHDAMRETHTSHAPKALLIPETPAHTSREL